MLSRTASELFWMARYLERAESYARVLDVTWKLSMIPRHSQQSRDLALPLNLSMTHELFQARHARFTMSNLLNFFALDGNNPCSIYSCVEMAWNNAHAVRGSLSAEVWESINATRIELRTLRQQGLGELGSDGFFEWVKGRVHLFRGAVIGTLLRNDALSFIGIGTLIERAFATTQRRTGAAVSLSRRRRGAGQRYRHRRRRRQINLPVRSGDDPLLPRRTADPQQYPHLAVPESRGPALCAE